jgi:hypothetical protein
VLWKRRCATLHQGFNEKSAGEHADWKAVYAALVQAAVIAEKVAGYLRAADELADGSRHPGTSANPKF